VTTAIKLRIPHERPFHGVARLVVGGLAARLDLSYEHLEDLQLALATVLEAEEYGWGDEVFVELEVGEDRLTMLVGPLNGDRLRADLANEDTEGIGLGRLLGTLVETVDVDSREGGEWLRLGKRVHLLRAEESHGRA
jgi:anti-sigma regulatory factor (Ser/Thr protein kinase)